ncbi:MAG: hypothetical protein V3W11_11210 [bacterium]
MNATKSSVKALTVSLALAAAPAAVRAGGDGEIPLYLWPDPYPFKTVEAATDDAYRPGELAVVSGKWRRGGLAGGAILLCSIKEPDAREKNVLAEAPFDVRYFYMDVLPPDAPTDEPGGFARARGLVAADDLYEYAYILRPEKLETLSAPAFKEEEVRGALASLRKKIIIIKLDLITGEMHHEYNKKYKIVADVESAELELEAADYERGLAVAFARLERLPPLDSDVLFRYLDVYVVTDLETGEPRWALACVGGYYLE